MSTLARLGKNSLVYGVGQVVTRALSVLFLPLFTKHLTPLDYGAIGLLSLTNQFLQPFFALGIGVSLGPVYFRSENAVHRRTTLWTAFGFSVVAASILWIIGTTPGGRHLVTLGRDALGPLVPYSLAIAGFSMLLAIAQLWLQFAERSGASVLLNVNQTVVTVCCAYVFIVRWGWGARGMLLATAIGVGSSAVLASALFVASNRPAFSKGVLLELLRGGIPLLGGVVAFFVLSNGPRLVLERFSGLTDLGLFTLGVQLAIPMDFAVSAFTTAWYPFFMSYQTKQTEAPPVFGRVLRLYLWGFGFLNLMMFVFARSAVGILAAPAYQSAYVVVGLVSSARFLYGVFNFVVPGLYFADALKYVSIIQTMAATVAIVTTLVLGQFHPLLGGALGMVSGHLALVHLQIRWNRRKSVNVVSNGDIRLTAFVVVFVCVASLSLVPRAWDVGTELMVATSLAVLVLMIFSVLAPRAERDQLLALVRSRFSRTNPHLH